VQFLHPVRADAPHRIPGLSAQDAVLHPARGDGGSRSGAGCDDQGVTG
jgi:hypothetical protein